MSSSFGTLFRVTTFGESHGPGVGCIVDGCPPRLPLTEEEIQRQLDRRRPGQSDLTTPRAETDRVTILSGVEAGVTLGTPIGLMVANRDTRPDDYRALREVPRPSHADFTYQAKYGIRSRSGGGRASARETVARVTAGAIAERLLRELHGVEIVAWVQAVGTIDGPEIDPERITRVEVDRTLVRCPDARSAEAMIAAITAVREEGDSLGGVIGCACRGVPAGWGEPVFERLDALLAQAMLSIPATKGFEIGSGFAGARMRGSEHNDPFVLKGDATGHEHQPQRRNARRDLQRRAGRLPRRVQAAGDDLAAAAQRRLRGSRAGARGDRPARPVRRPARGPDRRVDGGAGARGSGAAAAGAKRSLSQRTTTSVAAHVARPVDARNTNAPLGSRLASQAIRFSPARQGITPRVAALRPPGSNSSRRTRSASGRCSVQTTGSPPRPTGFG